jgi:alanine racemase
LQEILLNIGSDFKIYVLHGIFCDEMEILFKYDLIPVLNSYTQIEKWVNFARKKNTKLKAIVNIETGLNRLGLDSNEIEKFYENKDLILKDLDIEYIMSHLACSDDVTSKHNEVQLVAFNKIRKMFPDFKFSLSASYGIYLGGDYVSDLARIGVALYGGNPTPHLKNPMKNVVNLYSSIIQIKTIKQGDCVGYGCLFVAEKDTKIGIVSVGYADGIIRSASNKSFVYINNKKAKILGRISMDLIAVDITNFDENEAGLNSLVEIIGENQDVNDLAKAAGSIHCEVLSNISNRYPKIFIYNNVIYYDSILGKL